MSAVGTGHAARSDAPDAGSARAPAPSRHLVRMRFMPGLDGLRAISVIAVLLYHAEVTWMPGGFLGVDVFFAISGYLITALLLAEFRNHRRIGMGQFYLRRARRLLPALFLVLAVVSLYAVIFLPEELRELRADVVAALTYSTNWWQIFRHQSYFEAAGRPPLLRHLWSLAVEEQFYLLWPLLLTGMLKLWKGRRAPMLLAIAGGIVVSTVLMAVLSIARDYPIQDPSRAYFGTDTRISTMLVGAALAIVWAPWRLSDRIPREGRALLDAVGLAALAALVLIFVNVSEFSSMLYRGGFTGIAIVSAAVIAVTVHPAAHLSPWILGRKPLRWVGERSYGIYLWHWPVYMVTRPVLDVGITGTANLLLRLAITAGLAELSFRFVEQPVRQGALGRWWKELRSATGPERSRLAGTGAAVAGLTLLAVLLVTVGLASGRKPPLPVSFDTRAAAAQSSTTTTTTTAAGATPPPSTAPAAPPVPRVTAIGDSVMLGARPALEAALGDVYVDASVSRQFGNAIDIVRALKEQGRLSDIVVIHMGTNGVITDGHMQAMMDLLADRKRVVFVNLKVPRRWEGPDNSVLAAWIPRYPNAVLINWNAEGAAHPEFFYPDGYHLRPDGARYYAELIRQQAPVNP